MKLSRKLLSSTRIISWPSFANSASCTDSSSQWFRRSSLKISQSHYLVSRNNKLSSRTIFSQSKRPSYPLQHLSTLLLLMAVTLKNSQSHKHLSSRFQCTVSRTEEITRLSSLQNEKLRTFKATSTCRESLPRNAK